MTKKEQIKLVETHWVNLGLIENPDEDVQFIAVQQDGNALKFIKNPSKKIQRAALKSNPYAIEYIKNPSKKLQKEILNKTKDGCLIHRIKNPGLNFKYSEVDKDIQLIAVRYTGLAIYYIENPDKEVQMAAVKQNYTAIYYIKNPDPEVVRLAKLKEKLSKI